MALVVSSLVTTEKNRKELNWLILHLSDQLEIIILWLGSILNEVKINNVFTVCATLSDLGGDYMIPFCRDEILSRFAGILAV